MASARPWNSGAVQGEIVELRLERPEVKNAINWEAMRLLRGVVEKVEADDTVKVVLVTSSVPGVFCAGADLKFMTGTETNELFWS